MQIPRKASPAKTHSVPSIPLPQGLNEDDGEDDDLSPIQRPRVSSDVTLALWYVVLGAACLAIWTILILGVV